MAYDNFSCCYYWGSKFLVWWRGRCGDSPDDEVFCPRGILIIKASPVFYWENNLLNTSPPPTLFPIHLFLGETGGISNSETSRKFLRCCFPLLSPSCQKEASSEQDLWHSSTKAASRALSTRTSHSIVHVQTSTHSSRHLFMSWLENQVPSWFQHVKEEWRFLRLRNGDALQSAPGFPGSA